MQKIYSYCISDSRIGF